MVNMPHQGQYEDTNKHLFVVTPLMLTMQKSLKRKVLLDLQSTVSEDIDAVVAEAVKLNKEGKTVVIDARITQHRPLPVEVL